MKYLPASLIAILLAASAPLGALAAEPESAFGLAPAPAQPDTPVKSDSLLPEGQGGLPLIPEQMPPLDKPSSGKSSGSKGSGSEEKKEKKSATTVAEDALRDLVKLRVAKSKVENDPAMLALWDSTYTAKTDFEQRAIMTKYYTTLCDRIGKVDSTIDKEVLKSLLEHYVSKYEQDRIAPTLPPDGSAPAAVPVKAGAQAGETKSKEKGKKDKKKH